MKYTIGDNYRIIKSGKLEKIKEANGGNTITVLFCILLSWQLLSLGVSYWVKDSEMRLYFNIILSSLLLLATVVVFLLKLKKRKEFDLFIIFFFIAAGLLLLNNF